MIRQRPVRRIGRRGFTLLEVMLVIGLLALLAAFVIPNLTGSADKAKVDLTQAAIDDNGAIANAVRQFQFHVGRYPETLKELSEKPSEEEAAKNWAGPYIENPDKMKDAWGHEFKYASGENASHNENKFDLWSMGKDGQDGTDDDIVNWKKD